MMPILLFLRGNWKLVGFGLVVSILLGTTAFYRIDRDHWRRVAQVLRIDLDEVKRARAAEREAYRKAQAEAARMEAERLASVTAKQEELTDVAAKKYNERIARLRSACGLEIEMHAHDDMGLATANTLAACKARAKSAY
jgi:recombination DNA repair RAD52 pathway protein